MLAVSYKHHVTRTSVWVYPAVFLVIALLCHFWSGALHLPIESAQHQRDFNTALGITLLTALFWAAVRGINQQTARTLITLLLQRQKINDYDIHRRTLSRTFTRQLVVVTCLAPVMPAFYLVDQGMLPKFHQPGVYMITLAAIPFWLLLFLFLAQITSHSRYIFRLAFSHADHDPESLDSHKAVFAMAMANAHYALGVIAILPVFWINKPIPLLDMLIVGVTVGVLLLYLFAPICRVCRKLRAIRHAITEQIDAEVSAIVRSQVHGKRIPDFSSRLEALYRQRDSATDFVEPRQRHRFIIACCWLPVSLAAMAVVERVLSAF